MLRRRWQLVRRLAWCSSRARRSASRCCSGTNTRRRPRCSSATRSSTRSCSAPTSPSSAVDPTREAATNIDLVSLPTVASRTAAALHLPDGAWSDRKSACPVAVRRTSHRSAPRIPSPVRAAEIANTYVAAVRPASVKRRTARRSPGPKASSRRSSRRCRQPSATARSGSRFRTERISLGVLAALQTGNAEVVQPASVPTSPSSPGPSETESSVRCSVCCLVLGSCSWPSA